MYSCLLWSLLMYVGLFCRSLSMYGSRFGVGHLYVGLFKRDLHKRSSHLTVIGHTSMLLKVYFDVFMSLLNVSFDV